MSVRQYELYLIVDEVARQYFGQESKLFHLFLEKEHATKVNEALIKKQIQYITEAIPTLHLQHVLHHLQPAGFTVEKTKTTFRLYASRSESQAELFIQQDRLLLTSEGTIDAETTLFEALRKVRGAFFAIDVQRMRYGWLNPVRQVKLV